MRSTAKILLITAMLVVNPLNAQPIFTGQDYSGVYECKGNDTHEGAYTGTVTMQRKPDHSFGTYAGYDFKLEVPGYGVYLGHAAANGAHVAMYFALTDPKTHDFGTGVSEMKKKSGRWSFHKFYFEPEYKGGNTGVEDCVMKAPFLKKKKN
jgi:hypothetical protein